jgi:hypothetical protein
METILTSLDKELFRNWQSCSISPKEWGIAAEKDPFACASSDDKACPPSTDFVLKNALVFNLHL